MVVIRLSRIGRKGLNVSSIVVTNKRSARDGQYIAKLGTYNACANPSVVRINEALALKWLDLGAKVSNTVRSILSSAGIMLKWSLRRCVKKGTLDESGMNAKISEWEKNKKNKTFEVTFID